MILVVYIFSSIGLCYSTGFWLWTSDSVNFFSFLSPRSHECCWLGWNYLGWFWHNR